MYRPTLRRKLIEQQSTHQQPVLQLYDKKPAIQPIKRNHFHTFSIPTKLLSPPINNKKQSTHLISSLLVQSHSYPQIVKQHISTIDQKDEVQRGIGAYKEVNWFFRDKVIVLWLNDKPKHWQINVDQQVNCMTIGELKQRCLPSKVKRDYLIAIGSKDEVTLLSLNPYTLEYKDDMAKYTIKNALQISKIKFVYDNKILVSTITGAVELIQLGNFQMRRRTRIPFYRNFIPVTLNSSKKNFEQLLYTPKRIFALISESSPINWFEKQFNSFVFDDYCDISQRKYIQVYEIAPTYLGQSKTITQRQIQKKLKSIVPNWNSQSQISSIYLDHTNDKDGQLGIVTNDGCFLVLKNNQSTYLSKQPIFIPKTEEIGVCQFLQVKKLQPHTSSYEQPKKKHNGLVSRSLGYENLTLIEDGLFWVGDQRIDGILSMDRECQISDKNQQAYLNLVEQNRQWVLHTFKNQYYTIRQQPLRSFVGLLIYIRSNLNEEYEGFHYRQQKFKEFIDKQIKKLKPQKFLRYLIEIVFLKEQNISVNDFMLELIDIEMKQQRTRDFKQWRHVISREVKKKQLLLTEDMFKHIWSLILELQYKQTVSADIQDKSFSSTNVYWLAMHSIYYSLVGPLLELDHLGFKNNEKQVINTYRLLQSLQNFIQKKEKLQNMIRSNPIVRKDVFGTYNNESLSTQDTISNLEITGITNEAKNIVLSKIFHEKYNILEDKIKSAISSTVALMSIYSNLEGLYQLSQVESLKLQAKSFKDILTQKECQRKLKKLVVQTNSFDALEDLKTKIPFFNLEQDLAYKKCINKIVMENKAQNQIDLNQLANSINSEYFEDVDTIFKTRMDLKFKMLDLYYKKIKGEQEKLAKDHAQYSRNNARREIFPDDGDQLLRHRRKYFQDQIKQIQVQQKKCISRAISTQNEQRKKNKYGYSFVMDEIIINISGSIVLLDYMQSLLRTNCLVKELNQVQKIKRRYYLGQKRGQIKDPFHREIIPKELFPDRKGL